VARFAGRYVLELAGIHIYKTKKLHPRIVFSRGAFSSSAVVAAEATVGSIKRVVSAESRIISIIMEFRATDFLFFVHKIVT
tara:strand:+ start:818 stop:1060 length:243 start_codon:yes stop_codon:yes gene_type:complete